VSRDLARANELPRRAEGASVRLEHVPPEARRIPDLGTWTWLETALLIGAQAGGVIAGEKFASSTNPAPETAL
jgi:hypothetical protein